MQKFDTATTSKLVDSILRNKHGDSRREDPIFEISDPVIEQLTVGMRRRRFIKFKFQAGAMEFVDSIHLNHVASTRLHGIGQNLEHSTARTAIAMHKS